MLDLDRQAHPPMTGWSDYQAGFSRQARTLAAFAVAEASAPVSESRKAELLEFLGLSSEQFERVGVEWMWNWKEPGTAERNLELLLGCQREQAANLHAVEVIDRCVRMVLREHDGGLPEAVVELLERIGGWCFLTPREVKAVSKALTGDILAGNGPG